MDELNIDFGGYKDSSINGGTDNLSIQYESFIGPIVKAIQELTIQLNEEKVKTAALQTELAAIKAHLGL